MHTTLLRALIVIHCDLIIWLSRKFAVISIHTYPHSRWWTKRNTGFVTMTTTLWLFILILCLLSKWQLQIKENPLWSVTFLKVIDYTSSGSFLLCINCVHSPCFMRVPSTISVCIVSHVTPSKLCVVRKFAWPNLILVFISKITSSGVLYLNVPLIVLRSQAL